ncbi:uncharacterized protein LOC122512301 isoform X2 [Leptopilina heterotoma]|uniref:uncharacterized protein LOC122512301 isoform X2 n=1 Tax=Leptopilina heterotoma TaxID=63436 RepID=UPI001CA9F277|nr:uncharacterized protein LOC122512301 isoform X2 [Leptopilina heterotoma]XP_043483994.1 uncharacterized protein LOC122512301 isoform X2 [Leptopilina heterotoma]
MPVFKVWSADRKKRVCVICQPTLENFIACANLKLGFDGESLCLETDGTLIDSDEILEHFQKEVFILLKENENWTEVNSASASSSMNENGIPGPVQETERLPGNDEPNQQFLPHDHVPRVDPNPLLLRNINIWHNYQYDWTNLDRNYIEKLEQGQSQNEIKKEVIHKVILQMHNINKFIPCAVFRTVAKEIVAKYPESFEDRKNNIKFGNGFTSVYSSLLNHHNYLISISKRSNTTRPRRNSKALKFLSQAKLGATNWELNEHPEGETEGTISERKTMLHESYSTFNRTEISPDEHAENLENITKTFKAQRDFFNDFEKLPDIESLANNWPILSIHEYLFHHYALQMGHSIEQLKNGFINDKATIFAYGKAFNLTQAETADDSFEIIKIIFYYFKESVQTLISVCPPGEDWKNVATASSGPFIVIVENDNILIYQLMYDNLHVDFTLDFEEAVMWLYATFFVWNRTYPSGAACTLEFLQRYCLNLNPESGSKSTNRVAVLSKVNTFYNKLKKFCIDPEE